MGRIKDTDLYAFDGNLSTNDYLIGSDGDNSGKTQNYPLSSLGDYFAAYISEIVEGIDQDNLPTVKYFRSATPDDMGAVATIINNAPQFTISEKQIPVFVIRSRVSRVNSFASVYQYVYTLRDLGKDTYGTGSGVTLTATDLIFWGSSFVNVNDYVNDPATQIIALGDIGSDSVATAFNAQDPCVDIQDQDEGYVIVTATIDGNDLEYLFIGDGNLSYGSACNAATEEDFVLLGGISSAIENTSDLNNDGDDGNPFISANDLFVGNAIISNRAGVNHIENYSFEVWGSSYIINNVVSLNEFVIGNVELSEAHPTLDRKDVFVIQNYTPSFGTLTLDTGASGSVDTVLVDGVDLLDGTPIAFSNDLTETASLVVNQINASCIANGYTYNARNDGATIYIYDRSGEANDGQVVTYTATTITATPVNFTGGDNNTKSVGAVTGVAAADPYEPVPFHSYQVKVSSIDVAAASSNPGTQVQTVLIYDENVGTGSGEWNQGLTSVGIDADSTSVPPDSESTGLKIIEFPDTTTDPFKQIIYQDLGNPVPFDIVEGKIRFKFWSTTIILINGWEMTFILQNSASSNSVTLTIDFNTFIGVYGYQNFAAGTWQTITIPLSEFNYLVDGEFDRMYVKMDGAPLCFFDRITYQAGFPVDNSNSIPNLQQVTSVGNTTTEIIQTPSVLSDQLTTSSWYRLTESYLSFGDLGDGAGDAYGGSQTKYVALFDPNVDANQGLIHHEAGGNNADFYLSGNLANVGITAGSASRSATLEIASAIINIEQETVAVGKTTLNMLDPVVANHIYSVPARADVATTSYLALGITDGTTSIYSDSEGKLDISEFLPVTLKISVSASEIKNIGTTPKELIPAPGAGKYIQVLNMDWWYTHNTTSFDGAVINILHAGADNNLGTINGAVTGGTANVNAKMVTQSYITGALHVENAPLQLEGTDSVATGDGTLDCYITYRIVTL